MSAIFNLAVLEPGEHLSLTLSRRVVEKLTDLHSSGRLDQAIEALDSGKPHRNGFVVTHFQGHSHLFMDAELAEGLAVSVRDLEATNGENDPCLGSLAFRIESNQDFWKFYLMRIFQDFSFTCLRSIAEQICSTIEKASPSPVLANAMKAVKYGKFYAHEAVVVSHFNSDVHFFFDAEMAEELVDKLKRSQDDAMMALVDHLRNGLEDIELSNAA